MCCLKPSCYITQSRQCISTNSKNIRGTTDIHKFIGNVHITIVAAISYFEQGFHTTYLNINNVIIFNHLPTSSYAIISHNLPTT